MVRVFIPNSASVTGGGLTGLTGSSTNIRISFVREIGAVVSYSTSTNILTIATPGTWADPGAGKIRLGAVDATAFPGLYEMQFEDSATAFGTVDASQSVTINIWENSTTALNIGPNMVLIPLVPWDYQDGAGMGLTRLDTTVSSRATPAQVNTEVVDGLNIDTYAEPGQGAPGATLSLVAKINYLYKAWRNRTTQTETTYKLFGDDAVTVDQKATVSDDGTTYSRSEVATGP